MCRASRKRGFAFISLHKTVACRERIQSGTEPAIRLSSGVPFDGLEPARTGNHRLDRYNRRSETAKASRADLRLRRVDPSHIHGSVCRVLHRQRNDRSCLAPHPVRRILTYSAVGVALEQVNLAWMLESFA